MNELLSGVHKTTDEHPFFNAVKTFATVVISASRNRMFHCFSLWDENGFIDGIGGVHTIYLNHRDECSPALTQIQDAYGSEIVAHELEESFVKPYAKLARPVRQLENIEEDVLAIPTPGHCPGSTCFLLEHQGEKLLFTGDTFYPNSGKWRVAISEENRAQMIESLKLLKNYDANWVIPGLYVGELPSLNFKANEYQQMLDGVIEHLC